MVDWKSTPTNRGKLPARIFEVAKIIYLSPRVELILGSLAKRGRAWGGDVREEVFRSWLWARWLWAVAAVPCVIQPRLPFLGAHVSLSRLLRPGGSLAPYWLLGRVRVSRRRGLFREVLAHSAASRTIVSQEAPGAPRVAGSGRRRGSSGSEARAASEPWMAAEPQPASVPGDRCRPAGGLRVRALREGGDSTAQVASLRRPRARCPVSGSVMEVCRSFFPEIFLD